MSWAKLLSAIVTLLNQALDAWRRHGERKNGAREAELERRDKLDEARKAAAEVRRKPRPRSRADTLGRM